jgi:hypothetical protein
MYYYLIIALQGFCIYHLITRKNNYYWVLLILFIPVIGSIIYIFTQVYNKRDAEVIQNEITTIINPTKKVKDLEKKVNFADTYQNRVDLADAYFEINDFNTAIKQYKISLEDEFQDYLYSTQQLVSSYFNLKDYDNVIVYSEKIKDRIEFKGSKQQFYYGIALNESGNSKSAEEQLKQIDVRYSNYDERLELAKFYLENHKVEEGKDLLNEIYSESQYMTKPNKRIYRTTFTEVEKLLKTL